MRTMKDDGPNSVADLVNDGFEPLENGHSWGEWRLNGQLLVHDDPYYDIPLDQIESSGQMLDWIMQLNEKSWLSKEQVGHLVEAFDDIFWPQHYLCGGGTERHINGVEFLKKRLKALGA